MSKPIASRKPSFHERNRPDDAFNHLPDRDRTAEDLTHERNARQGLVRRRERELAGVRSSRKAQQRRQGHRGGGTPSERRPRHPGGNRSAAGYRNQEKVLTRSIRNQKRRIRTIEAELTRRDAEWTPNV